MLFSFDEEVMMIGGRFGFASFADMGEDLTVGSGPMTLIALRRRRRAGAVL